MVKQKDKTKLRRLVIPKTLTVLLFTAALLATPIVLFFAVYIPNRTSYLTNRNFRQLASISSQIGDRVDDLKKLFVRAVRNTVAYQKKFDPKQVINYSSSASTAKEVFQQRLGPLTAIHAPETSLKYENDGDVYISLKTKGET